MKRIPIPSRQALLDLYVAERLTTRQIAARLDVNRRTITKWFRQHGIESRPANNGLVSRGVTPPTRDELHDFVHVQHLSYETIAAKYGVDLTAVPYWLKKHGIPRPDPRITRYKGVVPVIPDADELSGLYHSGMSLNEIGTQVGVSGTKIRECFKDHGLARRTSGRACKSPTLPTGAALRHAYESGSLETAAAEFGCSITMIVKLCDLHGIARKPSGYNGGRRYHCVDGLEVLSVFEQRVGNWLVANAVPYEYEPKLPFGDGRGCRADFKINGWYVEIWGVSDHRSYLDRRDRKIELYREHGLPLMHMGKKCFYSRTKTWEKRLQYCVTNAPTGSEHRGSARFSAGIA